MAEHTERDSHSTVRVTIVADVRLYREGLGRLLSGYDSLTVTGVGPVDQPTLDAIRRDQPDVILLEAGAACGTTIVRDLSVLAPDAKCVAYGVTDEASQALRCAEVGVSAYVPGEASGEELARTILSVRRGEFNCSPRIAALLMRRVCALSRSATPEPRDHLTARELGIVAFIADGLSNKEIATRLGIELSTVKNHVHHILEKLQVTRRTQAVARVRSGRLPTGRP
jgi:two-component system, NarL family, nitrate/nitrite response regulator NarL